ncbi:MAG: DUF898 domain-containing protein [Methylobacteriaceae bacterium]|jgi:uncharacterized membrane protein YjgN (DUF898 family)|nr:DUF898 domain-containing protein [Methylobacteriaceae bacterium]
MPDIPGLFRSHRHHMLEHARRRFPSPWAKRRKPGPPPAPAQAPPAAAAGNDDAFTPVVFTGDAWEYSKIWMVNALLTLVTLGIYSAWATVAHRRWFHSHTHLLGVPLEYHGRPGPILFGRVLLLVWAAAAVALYFVNRTALTLFLPTLFILAPWVFYRKLTAAARNTSWRGVRFRFTGGFGGAFAAMAIVQCAAATVYLGAVLLPLLVTLLMGSSVMTVLLFATPVLSTRTTDNYLFRHLYWGNLRFRVTADVDTLYDLWCSAVVRGIFVGLGLALGTFLLLLFVHTPPSGTSVAIRYIFHALFTGLLIAFILWLPLTHRARMMNALRSSVRAGSAPDPVAEPEPPEDPATQQWRTLMEPWRFTLPFRFRWWPAVFSVILEYLVTDIWQWLAARFPPEHVAASPPGAGTVGLSMRSTLPPGEWANLRLGNMFCILFSLGLAWPWCAVRTMRFLCEHTALAVRGDVDKFIETATAESASADAETSDTEGIGF